jgi:hypothetical protein
VRARGVSSPSHNFLALTQSEKWAYTKVVAANAAVKQKPGCWTTKATDENGKCNKIVADSVLGALRNYLSHLLCWTLSIKLNNRVRMPSVSA